jgi:hypothetical protein
VEPNRENVEDLMRRYGYEEEEEAEIAYHLREARNRIFELERADAEAGGFGKLYTEVSLLRSMIPHFDALSYVLAQRVVARHYPEVWGSRPADEEESPE